MSEEDKVWTVEWRVDGEFFEEEFPSKYEAESFCMTQDENDEWEDVEFVDVRAPDGSLEAYC